MTDRAAARPHPAIDDRSAGYWAGASDHRLALSRCDGCGVFQHPPGIVCAACADPDASFSFAEVSGNGTIRSWTIIRQAFLPGFIDDVPYVLVDVELDEQADLRLIARLLDGTDTELSAGDRVVADFEDVAGTAQAPAFSVPAFRLAGTVAPPGTVPAGRAEPHGAPGAES